MRITKIKIETLKEEEAFLYLAITDKNKKKKEWGAGIRLTGGTRQINKAMRELCKSNTLLVESLIKRGDFRDFILNGRAGGI